MYRKSFVCLAGSSTKTKLERKKVRERKKFQVSLSETKNRKFFIKNTNCYIFLLFVEKKERPILYSFFFLWK